MLHAIPYAFIAIVYLATLFGLDKSMAVALKTAAYVMLAGLCCGKRLRSVPFVRWLAMLGLVAAMQIVEVGVLTAGETRPPIVCVPVAASKPPRGS